MRGANQNGGVLAGVVNPDTAVVTVWSDIGCPWATLALHTLRTAARQHGRRLLVDHRAFALELFNRRPTPKLILDAEVAVIGSHRPELGWAPWHGPDAQYPVTMLPALEAVQAAKAPAIGGLLGSDELDEALRNAFYRESRCISLHSVILEVAADCPHVDQATLADALAEGCGRAAVYEHWEQASAAAVQGSPHLFTATGFDRHNPGVRYRWTAEPGLGFPHLTSYQTGWADELLDALAG